jgi:hypothetical protein
LFLVTLLYCNLASGQCATDVPANITLETPPKTSGQFGLTTWKNIKWNKSVLRVAFLGGTAEHREFVRKHALAWAQKTNIKLIFHANFESDIRISFRTGFDNSGQPVGTYSQLGVLAEGKDLVGKATMNFSQLNQRNILHEFGHALGFPHEHLRPDLNIEWNKDVVFKYTKENYGWDKKRTTFNIFTPLNLREMITGQKDVNSIMTYPILPGWTKNGFSIPSITELSPLDIAFANRVYKKPFTKAACTNYFPKIMFDEFKQQNLADIRSWKHHCNPDISFRAHATDVKGRTLWLMDEKGANGQPQITEWLETHRVFSKVQGAKVFLEPSGKKAKELYGKYVPQYKYHERWIVVLGQGDAYMKKSYLKDDGTYVSHNQNYKIGQGKFFD